MLLLMMLMTNGETHINVFLFIKSYVNIYYVDTSVADSDADGFYAVNLYLCCKSLLVSYHR